MSQELMNFCKAEIKDLLKKGIIRKSRSPWSCPAFYVQKNAEIERGVPRLVINYKPLNKVLEWVRYPIPNKKDLVNRLSKAVVFSKFDMKSGFWQIQIREPDRYKTAFTTPFGHYLYIYIYIYINTSFNLRVVQIGQGRDPEISEKLYQLPSIKHFIFVSFPFLFSNHMDTISDRIY